MIKTLLSNYYETVSVVLFGIGFATLLLNRNLVKKILGLNIADTAVYLFLTARGYIAGRHTPVIQEGITDASLYINPLPTGLILVGIVISVSVTAFSLALAVSLFKRFHTLDLTVMRELARRGEN